MGFLYFPGWPRQADPELADAGVRLLHGNVSVSKARLERLLFGNSAKAATVSFFVKGCPTPAHAVKLQVCRSAVGQALDNPRWRKPRCRAEVLSRGEELWRFES